MRRAGTARRTSPCPPVLLRPVKVLTVWSVPRRFQSSAGLRRQPWICAGVMAFWMVWRGVLFSAAPSPSVSDYSIDVWQTEQGLPQDSVTSIVQTHDGYLWLGTYNGLVRFDGVRFKVFDTSNTRGLGDNRITSLYVDGYGTRWMGQETGRCTRMLGG